MTVRRKWIAGWSSLALVLALAAVALAAKVTKPPEISGDPGLYGELQASSGEWLPAGATPAYAWLRCDGKSCSAIDGACSLSYKTVDGDLGKTLRIRLTVDDPDGPADSVSSEPTSAIVVRDYSIPDDKPAPDTCTKVDETGDDEGEFESGTQPQPEPPVGAVLGGSSVLEFIKPFPVVRVAGRFTQRHTRLTIVSVRAPRGARIDVACRGQQCRQDRRATTARLRRVRSLQRRYRPGAVVEIRVTQRGRIGKYVRLRIRSGQAPKRSDRCVMPGRTRPVRCPAV